MPHINEKGEIGYYEWESKIDYEWLGISREGYLPREHPPDLRPPYPTLEEDETCP